ncbi:MAG: MG2 domain-containing protein [Dehalococcoidales bacterium]|nr:MG2 domain-containing protein [Dehalococcoidales bacterium]
MFAKRYTFVALIVALVLVLTLIPIGWPPKNVEAAESYMAIIPKVLHSGQTEQMSLALFSGSNLVKGNVEVRLLDSGREIYRTHKTISGKGTIALEIPDIAEGDYEIQIKGDGFEDKATVKVEKTFLTFLYTDKPIYKPGQVINIRVITLNNELRPLEEGITVEVQDARGIKIFRSEISTDQYGMATLELPVSEEPNLGNWKITAKT